MWLAGTAQRAQPDAELSASGANQACWGHNAGRRPRV